MYKSNSYSWRIKFCMTLKRLFFYGHFLALADYQYFKGIFDRVHLLDSNVELIFKYSIYDEEKKENILKDNYNQVFNLLKRYGIVTILTWM